MEQRQLFSNLQASMRYGETSDCALGGAIIVSAFFTELALLGILLNEEEKIRYALDYPEVTPEQLALVDDSVANVLEHVCCIEKQVIKKIELGIYLRNGGYPA